MTSARYVNRTVRIPPSTQSEAIMPLLACTMRKVLRDHTTRISKGELSFYEGDPVLLLVILILLQVPLEPDLCH
jgi:hypothetical protein